ncbi:hypothetical protein Tco_0432647 [Tanacetum coccineum]
MAQLEFCDKHNMVAYLVKSESNKGFDEIIDFLTSSHIYYALTENPIIFVSLIEQFWETTVLSTTEEGLQAISATIDGHEKLITEDSLRRHLKLDDAEGIPSLSNEEIFEHLAHMRFIQLFLNKQQRLLLPYTRTYPPPTLTSKLFSNMRRASKGYSGEVTPLFESMLVQAHDEEQLQSPLRITSSSSLSQQHTPSSPSPEPIQHTHKVEETASMPHDSPLYAVHSHGSAEGSVQQHDLTILVTKLNDRIDGLEKDLQQTKKTYSTALTKLVLRVKKLKYTLKSGKAMRKAKIVLSDDEEIAEDSSKQGRKISQIDEDPTISLVQDEGISWIPQEKEVHEKPSDETELLVQEETPTEIIEEHGSGEKGKIEISTANIQVSTASPPKVSTVVPHVYTRRSANDKGKAKMKMEEEERLNLEATRELQRQLDQRQEVPTQPTQYQEIDWNNPRSEVEKDSSKPSKIETSKTVEEEKVEEEDVNPEPVLIEKKAVRIRRKTLARRRASDKQGQDSSKRQKKEKETVDYEEGKDELRMWLTVVLDEEEFVDPEVLHTKFPIVDWESQKVIHKLVMERFQDSTPEGYNLMLWGDLKILVDPEQDDDIWKNQNQWKLISWKLYETCGVHTLMVDGTLMMIHMFVEKKYPLTKETLQKMLNWKLEAEAESSMAFELLKFIKTRIEEQ